MAEDLVETSLVVAVACSALFIPAWRGTIMSPIATIRNGRNSAGA
jgi:hypothetical protein